MTVSTRCLTPRDTGHVFRSELIDVFARLESWAVGILRAAPPDPAGRKVKVPALLGKRLDKVKDLIGSHPDLFRSGQELIGLLKRLEPYNDLRTTLVHGELVMDNVKGGILYTFDNPGVDRNLAWTRRVSLKSHELEATLEDARKLVEEIVKQARS
jgi:hypothetical protein